MADPNRFYMSSPRFYVEKDRVVDDISDYRYHRDYSGRHSIADLSLNSYRPYDRERDRERGRERQYDRSYDRSYGRSAHFNGGYTLSRRRSRSRSRSSSRSSSSDRTRTTHRSHRSKSHSSHHRSSHHKDRRHSRHHRSRHRSHSSDSSSSSSDSTSLSSLSSLNLGSPPQFVTPIFDFPKSEKGDLAIKIGDVIEVKRYIDRNWYKGINLTTQKKGIFPIAYVKEAEISSSNAIEPLSGRRRAVSQSNVKEKLVVELPQETERKGSFFYPTDTVIVRDRGNKITPTGFQEIDQDVILVRPVDTVNNEAPRIVKPTVEREIVKEEDVTVIKPHRTHHVPPPTVQGDKIIIPIRRQEIAYEDIAKYANTAPEVDVERFRTSSRHRSSDRRTAVDKSDKLVVEKPVVVERPRKIVVEKPREIEEVSTVYSRGSRDRDRSVKEIRLDRDSSYSVSPPRRRGSYKALPPPKTVMYNEYGAPVWVDTKTFAPAPSMAVPPRPYYQQKALEPAPVPLLPQAHIRRTYEV
ncbi:hypothetical protein AA313_de0204861 [Arthrobotrys entomopaga]|nr:hypothetical protein AA313_de0204861 [Arthrobotrys entomopaga]